jgi:lipoprotein-anchoring transpeptidase ErfK/SrfK
MRRRIAVPIAALAVLLLGASAAEAATLSVAGGKACYRAGDSLILSGTGYTPGAPVDVTLEGRELGQLPADAAGNISSPLQIGNLRGVSRRTLVATDAANPAITATAQFLGSSLLVKVRPQNGAAGRRLRISASGFTTGKRLYAHVLRKGYRRNVFIGKLKGPCRTLKKRKAVLSAGTPNGAYTVQFDTKRRYSKKTKVWYRFRVTVT